MRHVDTRLAELGGRCGGCGKPTKTADASEPHWVRATWEDEGYYDCRPRPVELSPTNEDR